MPTYDEMRQGVFDDAREALDNAKQRTERIKADKAECEMRLSELTRELAMAEEVECETAGAVEALKANWPKVPVAA